MYTASDISSLFKVKYNCPTLDTLDEVFVFPKLSNERIYHRANYHIEQKIKIVLLKSKQHHKINSFQKSAR